MTPETRLILDFESQFLSHLNRALPDAGTLHTAMKYALLNGGKRIRPLFCLEAAQLVSLNSDIAMTCAFALETVHGFSLVHDDLPSMDNDDFRRGQPTTHRKFGEAQALLAGDALLNFANRTFLECARGVRPSAFLDQLLRVQALKTGALFKASVLCPLLLAGLNPNETLFQQCSAFADDFGFAFQIADDLEDDEQDRIQGAKNILSLMGKNAAIELAVKKLTENAVSAQFSATRLLLNKLR
jgi:geranylgeranyl diphosphate synthase type II